MLLQKVALGLDVVFLGLYAAGLLGASTSPQLPAPSGEYAVGRRSFLWSDVARRGRPVRVDLWYPARPSDGPKAPYFPNLDLLLANPSTRRAITAEFGPALLALKEGTLRSNARENTPAAQGGRPFPVFLFSPGLGISPFHYTAQLEDLASHGYAIAAVEHLGDTMGVALASGEIVPFDVELWRKYPPSDPEAVRFYEARARLSAPMTCSSH